MAWTVDRKKTVFGNKGTVILNLTADDATQTIETGLKNIHGFSHGIRSMTTTTGFHIATNSNASGVNSNGVLGLSGFTSGDDICIIVYGSR